MLNLRTTQSKITPNGAPLGWASKALLLGALASPVAWAGVVSSGSDGSDGALDLTLPEPGTIVLKPGVHGDPDRDGVYHFTSVRIGPNVTLKMSAQFLGSQPITWLSSGEVTIEGVLDLNGEPGSNHDQLPFAAFGGAGGFNGGYAGRGNAPGTDGDGPGGGVYNGIVSGDYIRGGSAGHAQNGGGDPGHAYGNAYLLPLVGGSGGGGGYYNAGTQGGGGGGGGGAILIVSDTKITVSGAITARGGTGGAALVTSSSYSYEYRGHGGSGSGGAIRLIAPTIAGTGELSVHSNAAGYAAQGSGGRIRVESFDQGMPLNITGNGSAKKSTPGAIALPESAPSLRVVSVAGEDVPMNPRSSYDPVDLQIDTGEAAVFEIEASNIPLGTVVQLTLTSEMGEAPVAFESTPLAGLPESSTATASTLIPHGYSRFRVEATWE